MAKKFIIDYEKILQPINENSPCGISLREVSNENSQLYLKLKDQRADILNEENDEFENKQILIINDNAWQEIITSSGQLLSLYSKDLEVAVWILEGLVRLEGFKGLDLGLKVICRLLEQYEHDLHPQKNNEEAIEMQSACLSMLGGKYEHGTIILPIYFCNLLSTVAGESYDLWSLKKILETNNKITSNYKVTKEIVLQSKELMSIMSSIAEDEFLIFKSDVSSCAENVNLLNKIIVGQLGARAPNLKNLINVITYSSSIINVIAAIIEERKQLNSVTKVAIEEPKKADNSNGQLPQISALVSDKVSALKTLATLIEFFRDTEPHSPVSYLLERALSWSKLSLPEVICEMISDEARAEFCRISGVPFIDTRTHSNEEEEEV